jgi:hypothetical protein
MMKEKKIISGRERFICVQKLERKKLKVYPSVKMV